MQLHRSSSPLINILIALVVNFPQQRDTTVQSLTSAPSLEAGRIVWMDSPLVRAIVHGRVLVLVNILTILMIAAVFSLPCSQDEADKAPLEVVCILKSLIEDRYMLLADGRR